MPEGWRYGAVYPAPELVAGIAAETTTLRGTPGFVRPVLDDPYSVELVHRVLRATDEGTRWPPTPCCAWPSPGSCG